MPSNLINVLRPSGARRALVTAAVLSLICLLTPAGARAAAGEDKKKKNQPTTGRIEVSTQPGGYPILIDNRPAGETTDFVRAIELEPVTHKVEIVFPNDTRWSQTFNIVAGRKECIALNYRPETISVPEVPASPCPYPLNVTAMSSVKEGDIATFTADAGYAGQSPLSYKWTVSPPSARILSGEDTPAITVDSSGLAGGRVTAVLVVDDGSGGRYCRQTVQASTSVVAAKRSAGGANTRAESVRAASAVGARGEPWASVDGGAAPVSDESRTDAAAVRPEATAAAARPVEVQAGGQVEMIDLGNVTGTVCDCGDIPTQPVPRGRKKRRILFIPIGE